MHISWKETRQTETWEYTNFHFDCFQRFSGFFFFCFFNRYNCYQTERPSWSLVHIHIVFTVSDTILSSVGKQHKDFSGDFITQQIKRYGDKTHTHTHTAAHGLSALF